MLWATILLWMDSLDLRDFSMAPAAWWYRRYTPAAARAVRKRTVPRKLRRAWDMLKLCFII